MTVRQMNPTSNTRLGPPWLFLAHAAWIGILAIAAVLVIKLIPEYLHYLQGGPEGQLSWAGINPGAIRISLEAMGYSPDIYTAFNLFVVITHAVVLLAGSLVIAHQKWDDWLGLLLSLSYACYAFGYIYLFSFGDVLLLPSITGIVGRFSFLFCSVFIYALLFYLFPDGRFVPGWMRWIAALSMLWGIYLIFFPGSFSASSAAIGQLPVGFAIIIAMFCCAIASQFYRYRHVSNAVQRQQTKWVAFGFSAAIIITIAAYLPRLLLPELSLPGPALVAYEFITIALSSLASIFGLLSFGIAILRYHLWDIDVIIRRTLVYSGLTATLTAVYFGSVVLLQSLFEAVSGQRSAVAVVISTLIIAALFSTLRRRIQNNIDRRFFRQKYDAEKIVALFSASLREEVDLDELSDRLLVVVEETLQPDQMNLWLRNPSPTPGGAEKHE